MKKRFVIISVYNKTGIVAVADRLVALGYCIIASGGTANLLDSHGIAVIPTAKFVNRYAYKLLADCGMTITPEIEEALSGAILDHRVATISRDVDGGLLAKKKHVADLAKYLMTWIDMVIVDFYPFESTIAKPDITLAEAVDQIDVGGPHMIHSGAKGAAEGRIVICDLADCGWVLDQMEKSPEQDLDQPTKENLAAKADFVVGKYCTAVATYRSAGEYVGIFGKRVATCKYGENAHQTPAELFSCGTNDPLALDKFQVVEGTPPSYNNLCDLDRLLQTMTHIAAAFGRNAGKIPPIAIGAKHGNACGVSAGETETPAIHTKRMMAGDPLAIFCGVVMTNFVIDQECVEALSGKMLDGIIAPGFADGTIATLRRKGDKCRFIRNEQLLRLDEACLDNAVRFRYVRGGFLRQPNYVFVPNLTSDSGFKSGLKIFGPVVLQSVMDMLLAWAIGSTSNSNTITLVKDGMLIGNGVGQQDRVGAAKLAIERATRSKHNINGAAAYSDSFFPFPDGPQALIDAGVKAILTSSGSIKDKLTIDLCVEHGVSLCMIPDQVGRGFFGH